MGIQGLLQFLKEASEPINVKKYKGQTVAVDTYCWLHKGAFACAEKLAKGEPTDQYVTYCMKFVHMLLSHGVRPILVFDGCTLPSKKDVEKTRREKRKLNLQKGKQLLREGKLSEARDCFTRAVNITSKMAHEVIKAARSEGIDCIVAPYEADSQLAYLNRHGFAQAIVTEDSDLLAFGCKTVILKMDKFGNGLEIDQNRFGMCKHLGDVFTEEKFRYMCILSGCDYLPSIHGIGLAKASKLLKIANNPDITQVIKKIGQYLKTNITVPDGYIEGFIRADNTFLYQLVFDSIKKKLVPLNPYENGIDPKELSYAGPNIGHSVAYQIALGNVNVNTMEKIDDYDPDVPQSSKQSSHSWNGNTTIQSNSIWQRNSTPDRKIEETQKVGDKPKPRGLILPSNKNKVKRPHEGGASESDLLSQYSFSQSKKPKIEGDDNLTKLKSPRLSAVQPSDDPAVNTESQPRARNTFAALSKRKNEECGSISVPGTRSRFFCKPSDLMTSSVDISNGCEASGETTPNMKLTESCNKQYNIEQSPSPVSGTSDMTSFSASPLQNPRNCFSWSGRLSKGSIKPQDLSPSLLSLKRFQRTKNVFDLNLENDKTDSSDKPQDSGDQTGQVLTSSENKSKLTVAEMEDSSSSEDLDKTEEYISDFSLKVSPVHQTAFPESKPITKIKVPGLLKPKTVDARSVSRLKPMAPAKASGLSNRARPSQNNENRPGLQTTINDLWKNFSFKKH
ncbi:exonuclease 1 [Bufo gargarizans]|uniref:exonuclease 1 n=1 Tax=Bufo gargarizans TaxID=30331 RepID=UPI001CF487DE|nr:exonuclease 1 [Bufo gargarizans]XP_044162008.1 exonuclease 1 [Bufo gargarizans]